MEFLAHFKWVPLVRNIVFSNLVSVLNFTLSLKRDEQQGSAQENWLGKSSLNSSSFIPKASIEKGE